MTTKIIKEEFKEIEVNLMVNLFEKYGCHDKFVPQPGLNINQVRELIPDIKIDEQNSQLINEKGWFLRE